MLLLLHICCAPCFTYVGKKLKSDGVGFVGYFYNPNIHPLKEFLTRLDTLKTFTGQTGYRVIYNTAYPYREFIANAMKAEENGILRCRVCYENRLRVVARFARENGYTAFSTTLLLSPYQHHEVLRETAESVADDEGIEFYYADFREGFKESIELSRQYNLYRQNYCGCIFSEFERHEKKLRRLNDEHGGTP